METTKKYTCICEKAYNHLQNLSVHRKKCLIYQSQKKSAENITITIEEVSEIDSLKEMILKLQNENLALKNDMRELQLKFENKELQLKLQHKDEIIEILKNIPQSHPAPNNATQRPPGPIPETPSFNLENYLNNCDEVKSVDDVIELVKDEIKSSDLTGLQTCFEKQTDTSKFFALKLKDFINKFYDLIPLRCSDIKRKTIHLKEDGEWKQIEFDEYMKKVINKLSWEFQKHLNKYILKTYDNHKVDNDYFSYNGVRFSKNQLNNVLINPFNNEYVANQLLEAIKVKK